MFKDITPTEVLYFFNEPQIFVIGDGGRLLLALKVEETSSHSVYLVVPTSPSQVGSLKDGSISLRAAFTQPWSWIVRADEDYLVNEVKEASPNEVPEKYYPYAGVGLYPHHGTIKDRFYNVVQEQPFMSVKFEGEALKEGRINFGTFTSLVNETYSSLQKVFSAALHRATMISQSGVTSILQIPMRETRLASLSIEIDRPTLRAKQKIGDRTTFFDPERARDEMDIASSSFIEQVENIDLLARSDTLESQYAYNLTTALEAIAQLAPTESAAYDIVRIGGRNIKGEFRTIAVDQTAGARIRKVYRQASRVQDNAIGNVVEVNGISGTFLLQDRTGRLVTCIVPTMNEKFSVESLLGTKDLKVLGKFEKRSRRDKLEITKIDFPDGRSLSKA